MAHPELHILISPTLSRRFCVAMGASFWLLLAGIFAARELRSQPDRPLPSYTLHVEGGLFDLCGTPPPQRPLRVQLSAPLDITLRPSKSPSGLIFVHAFKQQRGAIERLPIVMSTMSDGSLRLRGILRDILDLDARAQGPMELIFVVNRSILPIWPTWPLFGLPKSSANVQILREQIRIETANPSLTQRSVNVRRPTCAE